MAHKPDAKKTEANHKHQKGVARKRECQVKGCKNEYRAKGYCDEHYKMWRKGAFGDAYYMTCSKEGCRKPMHKAGLCETHFNESRGKAAEGAPAAS